MEEQNLDIAYQIKASIEEVDPNAEVVLFGSRARGDAGVDSDWDILILIDQPMQNRLEEQKYRDQIFEIELEIEQPISVFVVTKSDWNKRYVHSPLYENIQEEGIVL